MLKGAWLFLCRDLQVAVRHRAAWVEPFVFFTIVMVLFPLASDAGREIMERTMSAVLWVSALFANFLALERLLRPDFDDGSLEQLLIAPCPAAVALLAKVLAYWLVVSLPLAILGPLYAMLIFLPPEAALPVGAALAVGTLTVNLVGVIGAALVVTLHRSGLLSGLLVMPLYIPTVVFGAHATAAVAVGVSAAGQFAMLGAMLILMLILAPLAAAAALRVTLN